MNTCGFCTTLHGNECRLYHSPLKKKQKQMLAVVSGFFLQRESSIRRGIFLSVWTRKPENKTSTLHIIIYSIKRRRHQVISGVNKNTPGECEVLLKLN